MPVVFHCPFCRNPVTVPDHLLGGLTGCPFCRQAFQTAPPMPVAAPPPPPAAALDFDGQDDHRSRRARRDRQNNAAAPKQTMGARVGATAALVLGLLGGNLVAPKVFPPPPKKEKGPINMVGPIFAGVCGAVGGLIGGGIGYLIDSAASPAKGRRGRPDD